MKAVVVLDGEPATEDAGLLADADLLVAADGGAAWLDSVGRRPDLLVGDLDSVDPALVERLQAAGVEIERHPTAKDASDAELAVASAARRGAGRAVLLGALRGERLDHELANVMMLVDRGMRDLFDDLRIVRGGTLVRAAHPGRGLVIEAAVGSLVTLLPVGGDALGVCTVGLRYPLDGETLPIGRARGLSNVVSQAGASVQIEGGTLLVIEITSSEGGEK